MTSMCSFNPPPDDDREPPGCPFSGAGASGEAKLSRRRLLSYGLGALATTAPVLARLGATPASATAASPANPPAPARPATPVGAAPIAGEPRWRHAVGNPRGSDIAVTVGRTQEGRFGVMFKQAPAFAPPDELLSDLAAQMVDPRPPLPDVSDPTDGRDNYDMPSGYVYLGQFMDHDITRDTTPLSDQKVDPHALTNFDTPQFDLGSVYGGGSSQDPQLYDASKPGAMLLNDVGYIWDQGGEGEIFDVPRQSDGTAYIGDPRNDENLIVSQLQVAFLRLHNAFLSDGRTFGQAQQQVRWHFQWIIVNDFLPRMVGRDLVDSLLRKSPDGTITSTGKFYKPLDPKRPMMPIEYSVAAYRFGHSMIRGEYEVHDQLTIPIFGVEGHDLRGSRPFPPELRIDWNYFFELPGVEAPDDRNFARLIDTQLSMPLASLPPTVVAPAADAIKALAARNLLRGKSLGLPCGQDVATAMGVAPLSNADLGLSDPRWGGKAPLWFYLLKEAELLGGQRLGPVGGRIVAEVILGLLSLRATSYFNVKGGFKPAATDFDMGRLLQLAGAAPTSTPRN